jgi:hypothetical protein
MQMKGNSRRVMVVAVAPADPPKVAEPPRKQLEPTARA